jgi:hypothetical protein
MDVFMNVSWINLKDFIKENDFGFKSIHIKYLYIVSIPILILVILSFKCYYYKYYYNEGLVTSKDTLIINVSSSDLNKVLENNKIIINNKEYLYKVGDIGEKFLYQEGNIYQTITLDVKLDKKINFQNYNTKVRILLSRKKIITTIYELIKGGENG